MDGFCFPLLLKIPHRHVMISALSYCTKHSLPIAQNSLRSPGWGEVRYNDMIGPGRPPRPRSMKGKNL